MMEHAPSFGWLTGSEIIRQVEAGNITIDPFDLELVNPNSYNYRLASVLRRLTNDVIDLRAEDNFEELLIPESGLLLMPGECYLGSTSEIFGSQRFPALITGRSSIARKFITNHITAGLIDLGFLGRITLEISVLRPTIIYPNTRFGQIFWFTVSGDTHQYRGKYQNQYEPTLSRLTEEEN
jgi:dCTP deaminase